MQTVSRAAVLALILAAGAALAEPYIAVRTGFKCSVCHVNGTGGGMRTDFGNAYTQTRLPMASPLSQGMPSSFDPKLNSSVSIGANWRMEQVRRQEYRHGTATAPSSDEPVIRESNLYVNIELIKGFLSAYIDETLAPTAMNREFHATVKLPGRSWFKFGRMLLPYGFRLMDDDAFVRNTANYTYNRHDLGYEAGFEPGPLSLVMNQTRDQLSTVASLAFKDMPAVRTVRAGASYGTATRKRLRNKQNTYGAFGGFALGMFTVLGERDWIKNDSVLSIADYAEVDFLPVQGLNFKFVYEYLWPDKAVPRANSGRRRLTVGAEPFLTQYLQAGLYWRLNEWIPQNLDKNQDEILGRLHVFF